MQGAPAGAGQEKKADALLGIRLFANAAGDLPIDKALAEVHKHLRRLGTGCQSVGLSRAWVLPVMTPASQAHSIALRA